MCGARYHLEICGVKRAKLGQGTCMFESLKCLCWSWDPTLQAAAQRTVLPLCGKAKRTETVCVRVLKLALQLKSPGVPLPRLAPPQLWDYKTGAPGLAIFLLSGRL